MDRRHLRYSQLEDLFEVACMSKLEKMKERQPEIYACGECCILAAESEVDLGRCPTQCPGFVDPLAMDDDRSKPVAP